MKLKSIILSLTLCITFAQAHDISIRFAEHKDIPGILDLSKTVIEEYFKPTIRKGYPHYFDHNEMLFNEFFDEAINAHQTMLTHVVNEQDNSTWRILIAAENNTSDKILGLCLSKKEGDSVHIEYLIVAQESRSKGIGKALLDQTILTYPEVHTYTLATIAAQSNERTQAFYERYGFTSNKELITLDKRIPNAHIIYELNIKKPIKRPYF
jgi:ribosomal protein S18 acetylase RimI-like enzyme